MNKEPQRVAFSDVETLTEQLASNRLFDFLQSADADDLARLYSLIISDKPTVVKLDNGTDSDAFKDGERVVVTTDATSDAD